MISIHFATYINKYHRINENRFFRSLHTTPNHIAHLLRYTLLLVDTWTRSSKAIEVISVAVSELATSLA
jgi:hypothetical protein